MHFCPICIWKDRASRQLCAGSMARAFVRASCHRARGFLRCLCGESPLSPVHSTNHDDLVYGSVPNWWNWRLSAHCRLASLVSAWLLTIPLGVPGWVMLLLFATRTCASGAQTWLNVGLGRRDPAGSATFLDWVLIGAIVVGAEFAAVMNALAGMAFGLPLLLPAMSAFTLLQVRLAARAYSGHRRALQRDASLLRLQHFGTRRTAGAPVETPPLPRAA